MSEKQSHAFLVTEENEECECSLLGGGTEQTSCPFGLHSVSDMHSIHKTNDVNKAGDPCWFVTQIKCDLLFQHCQYGTK